MKFEEEMAAGVFVDSICLLCGGHAPPEQEIRECCPAGKAQDIARVSQAVKH